MNLHGIVRGAITTVNPDVLCPYYKSSGYGQDATFAQVPQYTVVNPVPCQIQALSANDLRHQDLVNIEGVKRSVHMNGNTQGVVRADQKGGDILAFAQVPGGTLQYWKVVAVLETWPDWCRVAVVLQLFTSPPA